MGLEKAIDFGMTEEKGEIDVGTIIVSTGYEIIDPTVSPASMACIPRSLRD